MASVLQGRRVVLGVSGGIAAYKSVELLRLLVQAGAEVHVAMTQAARQFVGELTFETLSGNPVFTELFALDQESRMSHIRLADRAELLVVAPATANVIARFAHGLADDPLTTLHLASCAPVLLAPAMNMHMWENPLTQSNVQRLIALGRTTLVGPETGELAEGYSGPGRMAEPATILEAIEARLAPQDCAGARVVVSAAGTREPIDAVREIANRSSGKMGFALARAARARGADVVLVAGPTALPTPWGVRRVDVKTAADMKRAVLSEAKGASMVVMAAAVADYRAKTIEPGKIRKADRGQGFSLELQRTDDILASLGRSRRGRRPLLVGFAAETGLDVAEVRKKLASKACDWIVANDIDEPGAGFDADENHVWLVGRNTTQEIPRASKLDVAHEILSRVCAPLRAAECAE